MSLRARLILAFLFLVALFAVGVLLGADHILYGLRDKNLAASREAVASVTNANVTLSQNILTDLGEAIVQAKARAVASELALMLAGRDVSDYAALRRDENLRRVAAQSIHARDREAGYMDMLDNKGVSVIHPSRAVEGRSFAEWEAEFPDMWRLVQRSFVEPEVRGHYDFLDRKTNTSRPKYLVARQVAGTPFILCASVYISDFFDPVHQRVREASRETLERAERAIGDASVASDRVGERMILGFSAGLFAVGLACALALSAAVARPVRRLCQAVGRIGEGDFGVRVDETGPTETADLARAFNRLGARLKERMEDLRRETAARLAVQSEVHVAAQIQESLIPRVFPPFPFRPEFDLFALLAPAREVAGDYYDFFFVDEDTLAGLVADVSGKGIPAALFMTAARALMRSICQRRRGPAAALREANAILCQENGTCMFVTMTLWLYNTRTGELRWACGGHTHTVLIGPNGQAGVIADPEGAALGLMPDAEFAEACRVLAPGEALFLYSDGVTEARCPGDTLYGEAGLLEFLRRRAGRPADGLATDLFKELDRFQAGHQSDDITMLILRRNAASSGGAPA